MGSGWYIDDVELPVAPDSEETVVTRSFQSETLFNFFPQITKSSASAFDFTITGIVYPLLKAQLLEEIARSADTNIVILRTPAPIAGTIAAKYAIKSLKLTRKGPLFTIDEFGKTVAAIPYEMTFTELPAEGEFQEGLDGFTDADEEALGFQQLNELIDETGTDLEISDFGPVELYQLATGIPLTSTGL